MLQSVQTAHALISPTCGKAVDGTQYLHERDRTQEVLVCRWCAGTIRRRRSEKIAELACTQERQVQGPSAQELQEPADSPPNALITQQQHSRSRLKIGVTTNANS